MRQAYILPYRLGGVSFFMYLHLKITYMEGEGFCEVRETKKS